MMMMPEQSPPIPEEVPHDNNIHGEHGHGHEDAAVGLALHQFENLYRNKKSRFANRQPARP